MLARCEVRQVLTVWYQMGVNIEIIKTEEPWNRSNFYSSGRCCMASYHQDKDWLEYFQTQGPTVNCIKSPPLQISSTASLSVDSPQKQDSSFSLFQRQSPGIMPPQLLRVEIIVEEPKGRPLVWILEKCLLYLLVIWQSDNVVDLFNTR